MSTTPGESRPLSDLHRRYGARFESYRGVSAPAVYDSEVEEYTALRRGCGLVDRSWTETLEMVGEDRLRFLNGLVTCDVNLEPGRGAYGFLTSIKGRIMADVTVLVLADRLWLELPPGRAEEITAHLQKYVIVDRVEIRPLERIPLSLIGPRSAELLAAVGELPEETLDHRRTTVFDAEVLLVREPPGTLDWTLWVAAENAAAPFDAPLQRGAPTGPRPVGPRAQNRLRIEKGQPLYGQDYGPDNFPQETGLDDAVSYTKGCYLGQEIVARIHYRGGVNRHLRGLAFAADQAPDALAGRRVLFGGREAGVVSSETSTADGRRIGLAILHKRAEPGARVDIEGGGSAEVIVAPF